MRKSLGEQLLDLKERIEGAKVQKAEIEGSVKSSLKRLKKEFDCDSVEGAEKLFKKMEADIEKKRTKLENKIDALKNRFFTEEF